MGFLAFPRDENELKSVAQNKAEFDAFRVIGPQRRARGLRRGARGLRCMLPSGIHLLKESNMQPYVGVTRGLGYGTRGLQRGARGLRCMLPSSCPLGSNFSKMHMAADLELGASDVELGATDLDFAVEGSTFPKIQ